MHLWNMVIFILYMYNCPQQLINKEEKYIERDTEAQSNFVLINEQSLNEESYKLGFNKLGQRPNYS